MRLNKWYFHLLLYFHLLFHDYLLEDIKGILVHVNVPPRVVKYTNCTLTKQFKINCPSNTSL